MMQLITISNLISLYFVYTVILCKNITAFIYTADVSNLKNLIRFHSDRTCAYSFFSKQGFNRNLLLDDDYVMRKTLSWINGFVVTHNLCPWAAASLDPSRL